MLNELGSTSFFFIEKSLLGYNSVLNRPHFLNVNI